MDNDATALQNAVDVLRRYHGDQLAGPRDGTETQMRHTLKQQMGLDEASAGRAVKKLAEAGKLVYVEDADAGRAPDISTGPVISMPNTGSSDGGRPIITTASPDLIMGTVSDSGSNMDRSAGGTNEGATRAMNDPGDADGGPGAVSALQNIGDDEQADSQRTQGYWRIG